MNGPSPASITSAKIYLVKFEKCKAVRHCCTLTKQGREARTLRRIVNLNRAFEYSKFFPFLIIDLKAIEEIEFSLRDWKDSHIDSRVASTEQSRRLGPAESALNSNLPTHQVKFKMTMR